MAWKGVHISKPSRLSYKDTQLVVAQDDATVTMPLEDVAWIVLDTRDVSLTGSLLSACMTGGVAVVIPDEKHMPAGMALPFHQHHRQAAVAALQLAATVPLKKRLWQALVVAKIENQAGCLEATSHLRQHQARFAYANSYLPPSGYSPGKAEGESIASSGYSPTLRVREKAKELRTMAARVASGDPDNIEAQAARVYWGALFDDFTRSNERDIRNAMLNYGYAVLRAGVARAVVAAGLLPSVGLFHASDVNPFNLVDDVIEPFRPLLDAMVFELSKGADVKEQLTVDHRRALTGILNSDCVLRDETVSVLIASERCAASLVRALEAGDAKELLLPKL